MEIQNGLFAKCEPSFSCLSLFDFLGSYELAWVRMRAREKNVGLLKHNWCIPLAFRSCRSRLDPMSCSYFYKHFMLSANVGWYRDPSLILPWFNHPFHSFPDTHPTAWLSLRPNHVSCWSLSSLPHICMRWTVPTAARRNDKGTSTAWEATWIDCAHTWIYMSTRPLGHWCIGLDKVHHM